MLFRDRLDAGDRLADILINLIGQRPVVLGIPAGGVLVARVVADRLSAPLGAVTADGLIGAEQALEPAGRTVLLVDEGAHSGASLRAAAGVVAQHSPARIIAAVPVAPRRIELARVVADLYAVARPDPFPGIRHWYAALAEVSEDEVRAALGDSQSRHADRAGTGPRRKGSGQDWAYAGATSL